MDTRYRTGARTPLSLMCLLRAESDLSWFLVPQSRRPQSWWTDWAQGCASPLDCNITVNGFTAFSQHSDSVVSESKPWLKVLLRAERFARVFLSVFFMNVFVRIWAILDFPMEEFPGIPSWLPFSLKFWLCLKWGHHVLVLPSTFIHCWNDHILNIYPQRHTDIITHKQYSLTFRTYSVLQLNNFVSD